MRARSVLVAVFVVTLVVWPVGVAAGGPITPATPATSAATDASSPAAATGTVEGAAGEPDLSVSIDGEPIASGDTYRTGSDVSLRIEASVGNGTAAGRAVSEVVVRLDGQHYWSTSPGSADVTRTVETDLDRGTNVVRVIVTDTAGNVASMQFTIRKDGQPPEIALTAPYLTATGRIPDGQVTGTNVTLAGNVVDESDAAVVRITHEYGDYAETHVLREVSDSFAVDLSLGYSGGDRPSNVFTVVVTDEFGNVNSYEFAIEATDGAAPVVSFDPVPDETTRNRLSVTGVVRDDVWIDRSTLTVRAPNGSTVVERTVAPPAAYERSGTNQRVPFDVPVFLTRQGTYEVTVSVTDVTGETSTRSVAIERLPPDEGDVAPEIAIDRDRTAVLDSSRVFVSGVAFEGVTRRLVLETRDPATGNTLDYRLVHAGEKSQRVGFDAALAIDGRTEVIVRVIDANGGEHAKRFFVNGTRGTIFVDESDPGGPTVRVDPLVAGRPGAASASVSVSNAPVGSPVAVPAPDGQAAVTGTANVTLASMAVTLSPNVTAESNGRGFSATVTTRERGPGALAAPVGTRSVGTVTIRHSLTGRGVDSARLDIRVRRSYLAANELRPSALTVYRLSDGAWTNVSTSVSGNATHARYRVRSPGLSLFALAPAGALNGPDGDIWSLEGETGWPPGGGTNWTRPGANGTGDDSAGDAGDSGGDPADPTIIVTNTTVNRTTVAVNESVTVNATLENRGKRSGMYVAALRQYQGFNSTIVAKRSILVPAGAQRTITFTTSFPEPGNYTASVNGSRSGTIVVESGGGGGILAGIPFLPDSILGFFSFLPLNLIGMALGGLIGLAIVLRLVRFVLQRAGGEESGE